MTLTTELIDILLNSPFHRDYQGKFTRNQRALAIASWLRGNSMFQIAKAMGVQRDTISRWIFFSPVDKSWRKRNDTN